MLESWLWRGKVWEPLHAEAIAVIGVKLRSFLILIISVLISNYPSNEEEKSILPPFKLRGL